MKRRKTINKYANLNNVQKENFKVEALCSSKTKNTKKWLAAICSAYMISNIANYNCDYREDEQE